MDDRLLNAAVEAAQQYGPVFPLVPNAKAPAVKDWEQRATTDLDRIRRCWSAGPYNIGLATGRAGRIVVDLDTAKPDEIPPAGLEGVQHGAEVLAMLAQDHGADVPATRTIVTPSAGRHLYFTAGGRDYRNTAGRLGWHIDTRAHGGYVVAPGSIVNGRRYELADNTAEIELPEWLGVLLTPTPPQPPKPPVRLASTDKRGKWLAAAIAGEVARVDGAPRGQRNDALYMAAQNLGQLVAGGELTEQEVTDALLHAAASYIAVNPIRIHKAKGSIKSGLKAGAKRPRRVAA